MAMADTATTASAASAAASSPNASTDAPPFQLGKPRFQQVRLGLRPVGGRETQGRAPSQISCKVTSARGSPTRGHQSLQLVRGTLAVGAPFLLGNRMGEVFLSDFLLVSGTVTRLMPAPWHSPRPSRLVIGHAGRGPGSERF